METQVYKVEFYDVKDKLISIDCPSFEVAKAIALGIDHDKTFHDVHVVFLRKFDISSFK